MFTASYKSGRHVGNNVATKHHWRGTNVGRLPASATQVIDMNFNLVRLLVENLDESFIKNIFQNFSNGSIDLPVCASLVAAFTE
jgi:hypothetical protein